MSPLMLRVEGRTFKDSQDREVTLRGINVAGGAKFPSSPDVPSDVADKFFDADTLSFSDRPFPLAEAHEHFARLKRYGYNTIRYVFTWEAIEHVRPGEYDEAWIDHTIAILRLAKEYGFMVFMDPHQDVWSRFTGGSGAPIWTLYACGLNPEKFDVTEAALVQNTWPEPSRFPKMIWATNYTRLACQVVFTLFNAGRDFAPKAIIDGMNIQDYLQGHFIAACKHLAQRIHDVGDLENDVVIGWESMNEPNRGLVGSADLTTVPSEQKLQMGTSPTAWQAILTGSGRSCEIETWSFGNMGPYKSGTTLVDPKGESAWLPADYDDSRYRWHRDRGWKLGECLWAQHGLWDPSNDRLLKKNYFAKHPKTGRKIDYEEFTNSYFMDYYRRHSEAIKSVQNHSIMFIQPPVWEIPPSLKGTKDEDPNMVYSPHFYDGVTLMTKKWNRYWNVDVFGLLRGRYYGPPFAIKVGETAIRNSFRDQMTAMIKEGTDYLGAHPCVFTEIGIPYDMDDTYAYRTGDYTSQALAMDANHYGLEGSGANGFTLWLYMATNTHAKGDHWNGEDLSIYSVDDRPLPLSPTPASPDDKSSTSVDPGSPAYSQSRSSETSKVSPSNIKATLSTPPITSKPSTVSPDTENKPGFRAAEAYVRPSPIATVGKVTSYGFDLRNCTFTFSLDAVTAAKEEAPTEIFLPEFHFPRDNTDVEVSSGKWTISLDEPDRGMIQRLRWWHGAGKQNMTVNGVMRRQGMALGKEEEEGYLDRCQQSKCSVM
ncbi:MAG: hypothetical protein M1812_000907 [Candelaria pacifica]|nr:MAG: hypothetical protein M1812_000907 [Candelaria pacifica]